MEGIKRVFDVVLSSLAGVIAQVKLGSTAVIEGKAGTNTKPAGEAQRVDELNRVSEDN